MIGFVRNVVIYRGVWREVREPFSSVLSYLIPCGEGLVSTTEVIEPGNDKHLSSPAFWTFLSLAWTSSLTPRQSMLARSTSLVGNAAHRLLCRWWPSKAGPSPSHVPPESYYPFSSKHPRYLFSQPVSRDNFLKNMRKKGKVSSHSKKNALVRLCSNSFVAMESIDKISTTTFTSTSNNSVVGELSI